MSTVVDQENQLEKQDSQAKQEQKVDSNTDYQNKHTKQHKHDDRHKHKRRDRSSSRDRRRGGDKDRERDKDGKRNKKDKKRRKKSRSRSDSSSSRERKNKDYDRQKYDNKDKRSNRTQDQNQKYKDQSNLEETKQRNDKDKQQIDTSMKRPEDYEQGSLKENPVQKKPLPSRTGGVYIPPFKMKQMLEDLKKQETNTVEHQKYLWEMLRKSINGVVNKVNVSNIQNIILELFNENLLRGKGLLARAIIKAQMASPNFTHVYAALIAVLNTKLPDIVRMIIHRILHQFQRAYKRNNKIVCMATTKMIAHLVNQQVVHELLALQMLSLFLENPTEDSVEIAADFMIECGQVLTDLTPAGVNAIFERFRNILHEGEIDKKVQYVVENLFAIRKTRFADHPGVIPELDLVEDDDKIVHNISLDDELEPQDECNVFKYDENYEQTEAEWDEIKKEILGEEEERMKQGAGIVRAPGEESEAEEEEEEEDKNKIQDFTEQDLINLRRTIYLVIMSSIDFEECCHKLMKLNIREGQEMELCNMVLECCGQERTYLRFFGLLAQRLCLLNEIYSEKFGELFRNTYVTVHRMEVNKLRNCAKMLGHLIHSKAIDWSCLSIIRLTEDDTTSSSRIFIKILFQEIAENLGVEQLKKEFQDESVTPYLEGIFPKDSVANARFSINFFTSIGLGALTEDLREFIKNAPKLLLEKKYNELLAQANQNSSDENESSSDSSDSSSSSDSDESDDSQDDKNKKKKSKR